LESSSSNAKVFWITLVTVVVMDVVTKQIAVNMLMPRQIPHEVVGDAIRFTLVFNVGAAFGLTFGPWSRWIFLAATVVALVILGRLYRATRPGDILRTLALGLVCGGAVGNLIDRIRSPLGVVDFIDVGLRDHRWPTFNVADMAVSTGAILLAWVLWSEDRHHAAVSAPSETREVS
jgi:signal peptidase II